MARAVGRRRRRARARSTSRERLAVAVGDLVAARDERLQLGELRAAQRAVDVGEPVVEAELVLLAGTSRRSSRSSARVADEAVVAERREPVAQRSASRVVTIPPSPVVIALTGWKLEDRHVGVPARADRLVVGVGAQRVRGVLDDRDVRARRASRISRDRRGQAGEVHRHDDPRARRSAPRRPSRALTFQVSRSMSANARRRAEVGAAVRAGGERDRARQQLVARRRRPAANAARVQRRRARGERDRVRRVARLRERLARTPPPPDPASASRRAARRPRPGRRRRRATGVRRGSASRGQSTTAAPCPARCCSSGARTRRSSRTCARSSRPSSALGPDGAADAERDRRARSADRGQSTATG